MIQLLIPGMYRTQYLVPVSRVLDDYFPELFADRIESHDTEGLGMAAGIQRAWDKALEHEWDYLLHWEEDMLPLVAPPLEGMVEALEANPKLANVVVKRDPWAPPEYERGDVLGATCDQTTTWRVDSNEHGSWTVHDVIFSLNPCLIPRRVVEMGWPAGPLGVGNESGMTTKLLAQGYEFAFWGVDGDPALVRHIGHDRGAGWKL